MLYDATIHYDSSLSFYFSDVIWVCTLSDKKFRDPVYVKKHILNKHMEKVEAVKKDTVSFFLKSWLRQLLSVTFRKQIAFKYFQVLYYRLLTIVLLPME